MKVPKTQEIKVSSKVIKKARERAGLSYESIAKKLSVSEETVRLWEAGKRQPTYLQAVKLAKALKIPFGYLFLSDLPEPELGLADFRTLKDESERYNPDFVALVHKVQRLRTWLREYRQEEGERPIEVVGAARELFEFLNRLPPDFTELAGDAKIKVLTKLDRAAEELAGKIARRFGIEPGFTIRCKDEEEALRRAVEKVESSRIAVMRVGNWKRGVDLPVSVFRGFSIADPWAPIIVINSNDSYSAQIFTLFHELSHIWLGEGAISDVQILGQSSKTVERFCDKVAVHILMPKEAFKRAWHESGGDLDLVAKKFRLSKTAVIIRAYELNLIPRYELPEERRPKKSSKSGGGNARVLMYTRNGRVILGSLFSAFGAGKLSLHEASELLIGVSAKMFLEKATEGLWSERTQGLRPGH